MKINSKRGKDRGIGGDVMKGGFKECQGEKNKEREEL